MNDNARILCLALGLAIAPCQLSAQGFAGLEQVEQGYSLPSPEYRLQFPEDHGSHPLFRIEWWYVTANLDGPDGSVYGIQWTLFRNALAPTAEDRDQAWMGHAAISSPEGHYVAERLARGGIGQAAVNAEPFEAFIDEWEMTGPQLSDIRLFAQGTDFSFDLRLHADGPFVPQGESGFSIKSDAERASHYYSQPFYMVEGTLSLPTGEIAVSGNGWLDREWSSAPLAPDQTGWDWISLHLETGEKLMGYRMRDTSGGAYTVGTWIAPDGTPSPQRPGQIFMNPVEFENVGGRDLPIEWKVSVPSRDLNIVVEAIYPESWMPTLVPYWEGPVRVTGSHRGKGYLEMSGYD